MLTVKDLLQRVHMDYITNEHVAIVALNAGIKHIAPVLGDYLADNLKQGDLQAYAARRKGEGAAASTIRMELSYIHRGYRLCADEVARIPRFPVIKVNNARKGVVEREEVEAVIRAATGTPKEHYLWPYIFGYNYGCRFGEIFGAPLAAFNAERHTIYFEQTKNGDGRIIGLAGEGLDVVMKAARYAQARDSKYLFCERDGTRIARQTYVAWFKSMCPPGRLFHDLRRTAVRNVINAGVDKHKAKQMSGHRSDAIFDRYDIIRESDMITAAEMIEAARLLREVKGKVDSVTDQAPSTLDKVSPTTTPMRYEQQGILGILRNFRTKFMQRKD